MGDHESDGLEYQDDEAEEEEDAEPVHDLTGCGALLSVQLPAATAAPRLHNAPRECAIRMPRGKAANTGARGPITPATGPGQVSTLAEALFATGATFGHKVAKSVCSFCVLQVHSHPGAEDRRQCDPDVDGSSCNCPWHYSVAFCCLNGVALSQVCFGVLWTVLQVSLTYFTTYFW